MVLNVQLGLQRLSLAWWGLWTSTGFVLLGAAAFGNGADRGWSAGLGLALIAGSVVAHKITCWIVAGFFPPR